MPVDSALQPFCDWVDQTYRGDARFDRIEHRERPEAGTADLAIRLHVAKKSYYEIAVDQEKGELQAGFATEGRVVNEAIEQMVLDNGGDLSDLLGDELCDLGDQPLPMEHFYERPAFRFIVRLPLESPARLDDEALRTRIQNVLQACRVLFQDCVDEA